MANLIFLLYIFFLIYLSIVRFVYWATSKKEDCPISNDDKWNPKKWLSFAYGTFMEWLFPPHVLEQVWERYTNKDCKQCLDKGCCVNCGCNTYAKMLDPKAACSSLYWDTMMAKEQWEARKVFLEEVKKRKELAENMEIYGIRTLEKLIVDNYHKNPESKSSVSYEAVYDEEFKCTIEKAKVVTYDKQNDNNNLYELVYSNAGSLDIKPITEIETNKSIDGKKIKINKFKPYSDGEE
jgi:hypothetical protein